MTLDRRPRAAACRTLLAALLAGAAGCTGVLSDPIVPGINDRTARLDVGFPDVPPPPPNDSQLQDIYVGVAIHNRYALDRGSLVTSERMFVRFTLVITTPTGVRNVSHDAIRCDKGEHKLLAIGRSDGSWAPVAHPAWHTIGERTIGGPAIVPIYRSVCSGGSLALNIDRAVRQLDRVVGTGREAGN